MIGGTVVEIIEETERIFLNVQSEVYPTDHSAIYVERDKDSERIELGDTIWWQGRFAYWSNQSGSETRRAIRKVSGSGVAHPEGKEVLDHSEIQK